MATIKSKTATTQQMTWLWTKHPVIVNTDQYYVCCSLPVPGGAGRAELDGTPGTRENVDEELTNPNQFHTE